MVLRSECTYREGDINRRARARVFSPHEEKNVRRGSANGIVESLLSLRTCTRETAVDPARFGRVAHRREDDEGVDVYSRVDRTWERFIN